MGAFTDFLKAMKFSGGRSLDYFKKGNPFGKISDLVSTEKLRKEWNRQKNYMAAISVSLGAGKIAAGMSKSAKVITPATKGITAGVEDVITAGKVGAKTSGVNIKKLVAKALLKSISSGQQPEQPQYNEREKYYRRILKEARQNRIAEMNRIRGLNRRYY